LSLFEVDFNQSVKIYIAPIQGMWPRLCGETSC